MVLKTAILMTMTMKRVRLNVVKRVCVYPLRQADGVMLNRKMRRKMERKRKRMGKRWRTERMERRMKKVSERRLKKVSGRRLKRDF